MINDYSTNMGVCQVHVWELDSEGFYHCRICGMGLGATKVTGTMTINGQTPHEEILAVLREIRDELVGIRKKDGR